MSNCVSYLLPLCVTAAQLLDLLKPPDGTVSDEVYQYSSEVHWAAESSPQTMV